MAKEIKYDMKAREALLNGVKKLADAVVGVLGKTIFLPRQLLQPAFRCPRALGLQFAPQAAVPVTHIVDLAGRVDFSISVLAAG